MWRCMQRSYTTCLIKSFLKPLEKIGFTDPSGRTFCKVWIVASPVAQRRAEHSERSGKHPYPFQKKFCPKPWPPIFAKASFYIILHTNVRWPIVEQKPTRNWTMKTHNHPRKDWLHSHFFIKNFLQTPWSLLFAKTIFAKTNWGTSLPLPSSFYPPPFCKSLFAKTQTSFPLPLIILPLSSYRQNQDNWQCCKNSVRSWWAGCSSRTSYCA
jgi:hypothetical protein